MARTPLPLPPSSSGLTRGSRHKHSEGRRGARSAPFAGKKGDVPQRFSNKIKPRHIFSSPTISTPVDSSPSRPRIHLTMRCQARRGRRRGGVLSQAQIPGPLQRSPSGRGAGNEGDEVGCPGTGYPDRKDVPQRHTDKAPALSRTSRQRGETNGGDERRAANGQTIIPRARVPVGLVHHPAGTSRATGQAEASSHGDAAAGPAPGQSSVILGPDPRKRMTRTVAALAERRMQRE